MFSHVLSGAALAAAIVLSGCSNTSPPVGRPSPPADCGASLLQDQIGKPVTGTSAADARVDGNPVQSEGTVRIYQSGQPVTQDYSESRLNLETDAAGNLVAASCG